MSRKQSPSILLLNQHRQEIEKMLKCKASNEFLGRFYKVAPNTMKKYIKSLKGKKDE